MADRSFLAWPFFEEAHAVLAGALETWAAAAAPGDEDVDAACRGLVTRLGQAGWLRYLVPAAFGGHAAEPDVRSLCLVRETLARHAALADFAFAMQGLGSYPIARFGDTGLKRAYLPAVAAGTSIAAFALSEPDAGSDVAAIATSARREGEHYVLDGTKTWISNGGIADFYTVFARTGEGPGTKGLSAFVVDAATPGLEIAERIAVMAPRPLATLRFAGCRVPETRRLGPAGAGFSVAMTTLDTFRLSVGAAALGFARRALDEALAHAVGRRLYGQRLADLPLAQAALADMALAVDAAALLVYRAAWLKDRGAERITREASMAKLFATEAAQRVVDDALQLLGGRGVVAGGALERLYREVRALRIYEGASEVQRLTIARQTIAAHIAASA